MSHRLTRVAAAGLVLSALMTAPALAHTGGGTGSSLVAGFAHPFGGLDHMAAMVAIGLLAALIGGRALWVVPASFVAAMAVGGALGAAGVGVPFVEQGILASVVALGALVALTRKLPLGLAAGLAAVFAVFHGHAHGAEMPIDGAGLGYGLGFMAATALLHLAGIAVGLAAGMASRRLETAALRIGGAAIAGLGLVLAVGA